jgi:hypothetical protein
MTSRSLGENPRKNLPGYVKIIILAQSAIILIFTIGMYQDYLNNTYLQKYAIDLLTSNILADVTLSLVTMSVFALGTFMLLGSISTNRRASRDWQLMTESANEALDMPKMPVLEVVEARPKTAGSRPRTRRRRSSIDTEQLFRSIRTYADSRQEEP